MIDCYMCGGMGVFTTSEHHSGCPGYGEFCFVMCPVQVQIKCELCQGTGQLTLEEYEERMEYLYSEDE